LAIISSWLFAAGIQRAQGFSVLFLASSACSAVWESFSIDRGFVLIAGADDGRVQDPAATLSCVKTYSTCKPMIAARRIQGRIEPEKVKNVAVNRNLPPGATNPSAMAAIACSRAPNVMLRAA
jgi:hypothetical protein